MAAGIITQNMDGHWSISPKLLPIIVVYFPFITPQRQWGNEAGECRQLSLVSDQYHALYIVTHTELYGGYLMLLLQDLSRLQDLSSSNQKFQHFNWEPIDSFTYFETVAKSSK